MNAELAIENQAIDFFNANLSRIIQLQCTPRFEAAIIHCKNHGIEQGLITKVEGAIDENTICFWHERACTEPKVVRALLLPFSSPDESF